MTVQEYDIVNKIAAVTVDSATNMDVAIKRIKLIRIACFALFSTLFQCIDEYSCLI